MNVNPQTLLMAIALAVFCGERFIWLWIQVRKFDEKYGHTYTLPPGE